MKTCRTCRWWDWPGYCALISMTPLPPPPGKPDEYAQIEVAVADDLNMRAVASEYTGRTYPLRPALGTAARLRTGPNFGCPLHTEKTQ